VWDLATPGLNAGPEDVTVLLADGFSKDNTQDLSGLTFDSFGFKCRAHENDEDIKFCVESPFPVPGTLDTKVYFEQYARGANQYEPGVSNHRALPGAEHTNGRHVFDYIIDKYLDGTGSKATMFSGSNWDLDAPNTTLGWSLMVDFGKDIEVGFVQIRWQCLTGAYAFTNITNTYSGFIGNLYKANNAGGTPVASSTSRTSGTSNLSLTNNSRTISVSSGDFLGPITTGPLSNGSIVAGQSTLVAPAATFVTSDFMKVLKVTAGAGADIGSYRIINVSIDGSTVTVRNLNQTEKLWGTTASGVTYEVRNGVREEDMINVTSPSAHRLCVDRLLSPTSAEVRIAPSVSTAVGTWSALEPTWEHVKRLSYSTEAEPPDVKNNGTWMSLHGRENYADNLGSKSYMDLTDLSSSRRTGRWWKFTGLPRFETATNNAAHYLSTIEFYDSSGNKLATSKYLSCDEAQTNPDFFYNWVSRVDFIQSSSTASHVVGGTNGNVSLGGANGDTLTLSGGNKFVGWQIGAPPSDIGFPAGTNVINSASANWPASAMIGRIIWVHSGANSGNFYRVVSRPSPTQVTVTTPSGGAVSWASTETNQVVTIHEGINAGGTSPDKFYFMEDGREFTIASVNDAMTTLTIAETGQPARTNKAWEIRRPGYDTTSTTTEASKTARLTRPQSTYPVQSGDVCHDSRGHLRFFSEDIGVGPTEPGLNVNFGNVVNSINAVFQPSDVGRLLYITSGTNIGIYEISQYNVPTQCVIKNHYTGGALSLPNDTFYNFRILGDRRFRLTRYVTGLRA
jgi:hypothetical protein